MNNQILKLVAAILILAGVGTATPVSDHGQLSVVDGVIVDKNGTPPQLRGMSMFWNIWDGGFYNQASLHELVVNWKADVVRIAIGDRNVTQTKSMIDAAIAEGIYIIVDNHSHKAHLETEAVKSYFTEIATYVQSKGNPVNVIYELYNEPVYVDGSTDNPNAGVTSWSTIKSFALSVIPVIRAKDPKNLIVVGTPFFSQSLSVANADRIDAKTWANIAYAFHFYTSESSHYSLRYSTRSAYCWQLPVIITEWGTSTSDGGQKNQPIDWKMTKDWMGWVESAKMSWVNWSLGNKKNETASAISGSSNPPWNTTESGAFVKDMLIKLASGTAVSGVSSSSINCQSSSSSITRAGGGWVTNIIQAEEYLTVTGAEDQVASTASNGFYLGNMTSGATMTYFIDNDSSRTYNLYMKLSSATGTPSYTFTVNGQTFQRTVPNTGGASVFDTTKNHLDLPKGRHDVTVTFNNVDASLGFDYFLFAIPDSLDSLQYASVRGGRTEGLQYRWVGSHLEIHQLHKGQFDRIGLFTMSGRKLREWDWGKQGTVLSIDRRELTGQGVLLLVLHGASGLKTIKIPVLP